MPRFTDNWVVDRTMFDYVQGGSCACCGFPHIFAPGGLEGMIGAMSDLETDAANDEINAAKASPWPPDLRDQIWGDRLLLRFKMKKEMRVYREFLEGVVISNNGADKGEEVRIKDAVPILQQFCVDELSPKQLRGIFQLPRSELTEQLKSKYKICSAYAIVFCGVVDQVANFKVTGYGVDARIGSENDVTEEQFEKELKFEKVGPGFCLNISTSNNGNEGAVNEEMLSMFLQRMVSLAGPTLLARAAKTSHNDDESDSDANGSEDASEKNESKTTSFRSDRRVIRLLIARYWADRLIAKYNEAHTAAEEGVQ
ncbi:hypothetical protein ACHAXT_012664 [Thalassiosira profunda]